MDNDTFLIIFGFFVFGISCLTTLGTLYGNGIFPIEREWWDDDYDLDYKSKRAGKTSLKGKIKGIFISLIINIIFYSLFYVLAKTKMVLILFGLICIFIFFNMQDGGKTPDY